MNMVRYGNIFRSAMFILQILLFTYSIPEKWRGKFDSIKTYSIEYRQQFSHIFSVIMYISINLLWITDW